MINIKPVMFHLYLIAYISHYNCTKYNYISSYPTEGTTIDNVCMYVNIYDKAQADVRGTLPSHCCLMQQLSS